MRWTVTTGNAVSLADLKDAIARFSAERARLPRARIEQDMGELLLCLVRAADQAGVDLFEAGKDLLSPRVAPDVRLPGSPKAT